MMNYDIALVPTPDQIQDLIGGNQEGPVCMLNLLKFKEKAEYEDGRETSLSGLEAYMLYGQKMQEIVKSGGGTFRYQGLCGQVLVGSGDLEFDVCAIVEYPSREEFVKIVSTPEVAEIGVHRKAGLQGQLLIATYPGAS